LLSDVPSGGDRGAWIDRALRDGLSVRELAERLARGREESRQAAAARVVHRFLQRTDRYTQSLQAMHDALHGALEALPEGEATPFLEQVLAAQEQITEALRRQGDRLRAQLRRRTSADRTVVPNLRLLVTQ
jgi:hypothetical protein